MDWALGTTPPPLSLSPAVMSGESPLSRRHRAVQTQPYSLYMTIVCRLRDHNQLPPLPPRFMTRVRVGATR